MKNFKIVKHISFVAVIAVAITACKNDSEKTEEGKNEEHTHVSEQPSANATVKSPRLAAMANIGSNHVHIDYSAPSVRGRVVWGGLVAYDQVWVTGAHSATNINFNKPLKINGTEFEAGKYALFTIPGRDKWTVIINKNWDQHLADDYNQEEDLLRFNVVPEILEQPVEQLNYDIQSEGTSSGIISVAWGNVQINFPVETIE